MKMGGGEVEAVSIPQTIHPPLPSTHKPLPPVCSWNWRLRADLAMLHWFGYLKLRLSAFIKIWSRRSGGPGWFELTGLTPDTRYLPPDALRSSCTGLIGSDRRSKWKMLMTDYVSRMLPALADIIKGFRAGWGGGTRRWLAIQYQDVRDGWSWTKGNTKPCSTCVQLFGSGWTIFSYEVMINSFIPVFFCIKTVSLSE